MKLAMILLVCSLTLAVYGAVFTEQAYNKNGQSIIRIINKDPNPYYCYIRGDNYFVDFYVSGYSVSRWYYEPYGRYEWRCQ